MQNALLSGVVSSLRFTVRDQKDLRDAADAASFAESEAERARIIGSAVALIRSRNQSAFLNESDLAARRFFDEPPGYVVCHSFRRSRLQKRI